MLQVSHLKTGTAREPVSRSTADLTAPCGTRGDSAEHPSHHQIPWPKLGLERGGGREKPPQPMPKVGRETPLPLPRGTVRYAGGSCTLVKGWKHQRKTQKRSTSSSCTQRHVAKETSRSWSLHADTELQHPENNWHGRRGHTTAVLQWTAPQALSLPFLWKGRSNTWISSWERVRGRELEGQGSGSRGQ